MSPGRIKLWLIPAADMGGLSDQAGSPPDRLGRSAEYSSHNRPAQKPRYKPGRRDADHLLQ